MIAPVAILAAAVAPVAGAALTLRQFRRCMITRAALTRPGFTAWQVAGARGLSRRLLLDALLWAVITLVEIMLAGFILERVL